MTQQVNIKGGNAAGASSVDIPSHNPGDLIIIFAFDDNPTATIPATPAADGTIPTWETIDSTLAADSSCTAAYFVATANDHTSGTWTGATGIIALVLSGQKSGTPIGGHAAAAGRLNGTYNAAPAITLEKDDGSSAILYFFGHRLASGWPAAPDGYTQPAAAGEVMLPRKRRHHNRRGRINLQHSEQLRSRLRRHNHRSPPRSDIGILRVLLKPNRARSSGFDTERIWFINGKRRAPIPAPERAQQQPSTTVS